MNARVGPTGPAVSLPDRTSRLRMLANSAASLAERLRDVAALSAVGADVQLSVMEVGSLAGRLSEELRRLAPLPDSK